MKPLEQALYALMSDLSEACWAAGWLSGTEFDIWALIVGDKDRWAFHPVDVLTDELAAIESVSTAAQAWIVWEGNEPVAVPLDDWRARYRQKRAS